MSAAPPTTAEIRARLAALLPEFRARYGVRALSIFGSYARGEQTPESALDLLVAFDRAPTLYTFGGLTYDLQEALGLRVQLATPDDLPAEVLGSALQDHLAV